MNYFEMFLKIKNYYLGDRENSTVSYIALSPYRDQILTSTSRVLQENVVALCKSMFSFFSSPANPHSAKLLQIPRTALVNYFMQFSRLRKKVLI